MNAITNNNIVRPVDNDHSEIGVSGREQADTAQPVVGHSKKGVDKKERMKKAVQSKNNHIIGIVIHAYNHNSSCVQQILYAMQSK